MTNESPWRIPLADVSVDDELVAAAEAAIRSGWWSTGPRVAQLEEEFTTVCDVPHTVATSSGTAALHLALLATGCGAGDEIIMPSLNFVAAANATRLIGAVPVFCDVTSPTDLNLDPAEVEAAITDRTKALIALHYAGVPCQVTALAELAERRDLVLIEDAAHAPGASVRGQPCGSFGVVGCFSFFSNKNVPIGEGGMLVSTDAEVAARAGLLRSHGMTTLTWDRHRGHAHSYDVLEHGLNYRLDEIRAAMALVQLQRLPERNAARAELIALYARLLHGVAGVEIPFHDLDEGCVSAHHIAVAVLPAHVERDAVRHELRQEGIQTSVHYPPVHGFSAFAERPPNRELPRTDEIAKRLITLPLYPELEARDVETVCETLVAALSR